MTLPGAATSGSPVVCGTAAQLAAARRALAVGARAGTAVVLTMGALHDGHVALLRAARAGVGVDGVVLATIFVNPLQFGPAEDFARYPRDLDADLAVCAREGVDLVFAPDRDEVYPREPVVRVDPGPLGAQLEGGARPGHFTGVLTVVAKLLHLVGVGGRGSNGGVGVPAAYFGEKDYQQLVLVQRMVADLDFAVQVHGVPTVREPDGLALSSRNRYLSPPQRHSATALSRALRAGAAAALGGPAAVVAAAEAVLSEEPGVAVDYVELRDPDLGPPPAAGPARLLVAARVGGTRLIDNVPVQLPLG